MDLWHHILGESCFGWIQSLRVGVIVGGCFYGLLFGTGVSVVHLLQAHLGRHVNQCCIIESSAGMCIVSWPENL